MSRSRCRGDASGARPDGRTAGHAPRIWRTGPCRSRTGAPVHVVRVRAHRDYDDVPAMRVLRDARHAGHDVRGQAQHALERAG